MVKARFIEMKNAYGIGDLHINFKSEQILYQSLIYSRNGTFKTSFSRTLNDLSKGNKIDIKDRLTNEPSSIKIEFIHNDGTISTNDYEGRFIVFSRELYEQEDAGISNYNNELCMLTSDNESKSKLSKLLHSSTEKIKESLKTKLKSSGLNVDKSIEVLTNKNIDFLDINELQSLLIYLNSVESSDISKVPLKKLFQKAYDPIDNDNFKNAAFEMLVWVIKNGYFKQE